MPDVLARLTSDMKAEFDALKDSLRAELPAAWKDPTNGDLVGALAVIVREKKVRAKLRDALDTYHGEKPT